MVAFLKQDSRTEPADKASSIKDSLRTNPLSATSRLFITRDQGKELPLNEIRLGFQREDRCIKNWELHTGIALGLKKSPDIYCGTGCPTNTSTGSMGTADDTDSQGDDH